jgi:hypothetical protein
MPAEFRHIQSKTDTCEPTPNAASQCSRSTLLSPDGATENFAHFFLHATAVTTCLPLESSLNAIFQISDNQLRHWSLLPLIS